MLDTLISGLITGNTYALIAIGLSLIFGVAELVNFAHGSVFAVGAMIGWWLVAVQGWPLWAALPATILATALLGLAIERFCIRPLADAPPIAPLLATVAVSLILDYAAQLIFSPETRRFPALLPTGNLRLGGLRVGTLDLAILGVSLGSVALLGLFLRHTRLGAAIRATAQDREAAQQMGVAIGAIQGLSFAIASGLAGIGGVLVGMYYSSVNPTIGFNAGLEGFAAATLGGLGSLPGALLGGLLLGVAESFGVTWFGGSARTFITFAVLIGVLWLRPQGLFGSAGLALREPLTGTFFRAGRPVRFRRWQVLVCVLLAVVVLPLVGGNYLLRVGALVAIYATLALSLTLVSGTAGQISLGQAGLLAIGAYTSALLATAHGWPFWATLPAAGIITGVLAAVIVAPALRLRGHYVSIATLGIGALVGAALLNFEGLTRGSLGISSIPAPALFGRALDTPGDFYLLSLVVLGACAALVAALQRSHLGRAWRAIREDEIGAQSFGVPLGGYKALVFALGGVIAGLGGSLLAYQYTFISPDVFTVAVSVLALTIVVLGGMANIPGAILGALVLVGVPELFRPLADARLLAYGVLLLLLVRFRPQGLLGSR